MLPRRPVFCRRLLTLGLDSMFGTIEGILASIDDMGWQRRAKVPKHYITIGVSAFSFLVGLIFCDQSGVYIFEVFDQFSACIPLLVIVLCELIAVSYVYGVDLFVENIEQMIGRKISNWWWWCWKFIAPVWMLVLLIWSLVQSMSDPGEYATSRGLQTFPGWAIGLGWVLIISSVACIPAVAVYERGLGATLSSCGAAAMGCLRLGRADFRPKERKPIRPAGADGGAEDAVGVQPAKQLVVNDSFDNPVFNTGPDLDL